jgi:asparagine synthase (glutamine-hydrolysing)
MQESPTPEPTRSDDSAGPVWIRATPGCRLGGDAVRHRAHGRIGGVVGSVERTAFEALATSLGTGAQILDGTGTTLVADFDACWIEGRPLEHLAQWHRILQQERLAAVSGAFAVAWLKPDGGAVCLARDAIGERGLFYAKIPGGLIFASTLHAILATGLIDPLINLTAVARYLSYAYLPGAETLISGISKVLPGEVVEFRNGQLSFSRFWSLPAEAHGNTAPDEDGLRQQLRAELEAAVVRQLPGGGPVGAFLSGGLDSSLVVALARRLYNDEILTYSVSFGPEYANELPYSSCVARHCRTRHHVVELSPAVVLRHLDESIAFLSDPVGDPLTVPNALLFREAAQQTGAVLNGEGGDPCFGGPKNVPMLLAELFGDGAEEASTDAACCRERSYLRAHQKCYDDLRAMLTSDVRAAIADNALELQLAPFFGDPRWTSFIAKLMALNISFKAPFHILHKVDSVSAPFGAVARSPLFDRAIVETAMSIPSQLKLQGSSEKYLLKQAVRDLLPPAIIERPKSGMLVPVEGWFKGPLLNVARERLLDGLAGVGLFERTYLERLLDGRMGALRPRRGVKIWLLLTLESWLRSARGHA